ncbi:hypothetical protein [Roseovarius sp. EL26]|uniref:hypothetical protein n=1 Tax=Roseovarius sp. EL26 TaxID=2126672 RepID=UPI0020B176C2|nr:hypothetical protein [Roseovarius sp. EL26]
MKNSLLLGVAVLLTACGGGRENSRPTSYASSVSRAAPLVNGPINKACLASDRKARSRQLCGCIQAVANQTLTIPEQRRAILFYQNPHLAQEVRQSDRTSDEQFWKTYVNYGERAKATCT